MTVLDDATSPTDPPAEAESAVATSSELGRAAAIVGAATLAASVANYGLNLALARLLSPAGFGDANLIVTALLALTAVAVTMQLIAAQRISGQGWSPALVRRVMLRRAWSVGAAVAVGGVAASGWLRDVTSSDSALPFAVLAVGIPWFLAQAVERGVLQGVQRFGALAATLLAEAGIRLAVSLALVVAGFGVAGASVGIACSFLASWGVARWCLRGTTSGGGDHPGRTAADRAATTAAATLLVGQIVVNNGDVVLAKVLFDPDDAGVHAVVALIGRAIFFLSWSVVTAAFPEAAGRDDRSVDRRAVRLVTGVSIVLTVGAGLVAPLAAPIVFGPGYESAATLFLPYAIATSLFSIANVRAALATARGDAGPARLVVAAGFVQVGVLAILATDLVRMTWLQVVVMGGLLLAVEISGRSRDSARAIAGARSR